MRMGGSKLTVALRGRPLITYPLQALGAALRDVAVIGKPDLELPSISGVMVWIEPEEPRHPLVGIVEAIALAGGRSVLVCAGDLPFVTPSLITRLANTSANGAPAVIAAGRSGPQPLLGCYRSEAAALLAPAARQASGPVREAVLAIGPRLLEVGDEQELFNVNSPDDLLLAAAILDERDRALRDDGGSAGVPPRRS